MYQIVLKLKDDNKRGFFLKLIEQFNFIEIVEVKKEVAKSRILNDFKEALNDIELHREAKKKLKTAKQLLDEL